MERIDLGNFHPSVQRVWRDGNPWLSSTIEITVGKLPDGRWYVTVLSTRRMRVRWARSPGCAYAGPNAEHYARATARRWRRTFGGEWREC